MTTACTYKEIWAEHDRLHAELETLKSEAAESDLTLPQYAGANKLGELAEELETLLADSEGLATEADRNEVQASICGMLHEVETAFSDAFLYECEPEADPDRFSFR